MAAESYQSQPERTSKEIAARFAEAQSMVYKLTSSTRFYKLCADRKINPARDSARRPYLEAVSDYADSVVQREDQSCPDPLKLHAFGLFATAPLAIYDDALLKHSKTSAQPHPDFRIARRNVSIFNGRLRTFSSLYPQVKKLDMAKAIVNATNILVENRAVKLGSGTAAGAMLRGAQHESAYGQTLGHTGRSYDPASTEMDLRGIDWVVEGLQPGRTLDVDVKASLTEINNPLDPGKAYALRSGTIVMHSLTLDTEFRGTMLLPDEVAAAKAPFLDELLALAEDDTVNRK